MKEEIQERFARIISSLPKVLGEDYRVLDAENLPQIEAAELHTNQIVLRKRWHTYNDCYRIEQMHLCAAPEYYQILGLAMFCAVFQQEEITIRLTNPLSFIRKIVIGSDTKNQVGLSEKPMEYRFYAEEILGKHSYHGVDKSHFPSICLVSDADNCYTEADWAARNMLKIGHSNKQIAHFAALFLNFGNPNNQQPELVLEGHAGNCCIQPTSVEMNCWLPDSLGFIDF